MKVRSFIGPCAILLLLARSILFGDQVQGGFWREYVREHSRELVSVDDLATLVEKAADRRLVLLGEASHGTHEFYVWRDAISRRLIEDHRFSFIAVEGDWASIQTLNQYVKGEGKPGRSARELLHAFDRWPTWMWANEEVVELAEWLRAHNAKLPPGERTGVYGIDLYDAWKSMDQVIDYLEREGEELGKAARRHYREWSRYRGDGHAYGRAVFAFLPTAEEGVQAVLEMLRDLRPAPESPTLDGWFGAIQNAKVVHEAERHFRKMTEGGPASWNVRAVHMHSTVRDLLDHYGPEARGIVWAHNTHVGDARATSMRQWGQVNLGQLAREELGAKKVFSVGFGMARGVVVAAREWGGDREMMTIPAPSEGSWEELFSTGSKRGDFWLRFDPVVEAGEWLKPLGHRAIGVLYHPEREREGNYVPTVLAERYDAFLFFQETRGLRPLH